MLTGFIALVTFLLGIIVGTALECTRGRGTAPFDDGLALSRLAALQCGGDEEGAT